MRKILFGLLLFTVSLQAVAADDVLSILGDSQDKKEQQQKPVDPNAPPVKEEGIDISPYKAIFQKMTPSQVALFETMVQGDMAKALSMYSPAFAGTEAGRSANGQALLAYLMLKNGLKVTGLETLFATVAPEKLSPYLASMIREEVSDTDNVWRLARVEWKPKWTEVFSPSIEVQVKSRKFFGAKNVEELKNIIRVAAPGTRDRGAIQWQLLVAMSLSGDSVTAAKLLNNLMGSKENPVQPDLMNMTAARMLFENGYMDAAIKYYRKIPTKSEYWLEAQEEMGWAYIRKGEPQNTIAVTQGLIIPELQNIVGAETVFLRSLGLLKICDYPGVVKSLSLFKARFKPKTVELMKIAENPDQPAVKDFFAKMKQHRLAIKEMGPFAGKLPHLINRDEALYQNLLLSQQLEKELALVTDLSKKNSSQESAYLSAMEDLQKRVMAPLGTSEATALDRVQALAKAEIANTHRLLQKLHIVEAEALQQTIIAQQKIAKAVNTPKDLEKRGTTGSLARDVVKFPVDDKQIWFDEIAHYRVDVVKGCRSIKQ